MNNRMIDRETRREGTSADYLISKHGARYWAVRDPAGELVAVTVYKKGAAEIVRRLSRCREARKRR